jgi:hypothetical protein
VKDVVGPNEAPVRESCALGTEWLLYGWPDGGQALLGICQCNQFEECDFCGEPHVFVALCSVCASREGGET